MVYVMKKIKTQKFFRLLKIDLEKAYHILNLKFVSQCLQDCKFPKELFNLIY